MKFEFPFKLKANHLMIVLAGLGALLIGMAVLGLLGVPIPKKLASDLSNGVMIAALVVFLYSRKLRVEEKKAAASKKRRPPVRGLTTCFMAAF